MPLEPPRLPEPALRNRLASGVTSLGQDVRQALRASARSPGFATAAILILALSIGASTALFSVIEAAVVAAPPFPQADRLVVVDTLTGMPDAGMQPALWSYPRFRAFRDDVRSVEQLAGYGRRTMTLTEMGLPAVIPVEVVTPSIFPLLGVEVVQGRVFGSAEEDNGAAVLAALVSYRFWQTRLGGAADAAGRVVTLDRLRFQVVGILQQGFDGLGGDADAWISFAALRAIENDDMLDNAWSQHFNVIGRLAPGVGIPAARSEAAAFGTTITQRFPPPAAAARLIASADVVPYLEARVNPLARTSMLALFAAIGLVLLIATANLAGLLLARGAWRQRDAAIRVSLGAGRARLVRQMLTESLALSCAGGLLGIVAAWSGVAILGTWLAQAIGTTGSRGLEYLDTDSLGVNWRVLAFALSLTVSVGVAFGIFPAWQAARTDPNAALKSDPSGAMGTSRSAGRGALIAVQVAVTLVLLAAAWLTLTSLANIQGVGRGYDSRNLLTAVYALTPSGPQAGAESAAAHLAFLDRVRALPGVAGATLGEVPLGGPTLRTIVMASDGRPELRPTDHIRIRVLPVADGHLGMMGATLVEGRDIQSFDTADVDPVVVLNQTAVAELFPDGRALGRRMELPYPGYLGVGAVVVGIVEDLQMGQAGDPGELQAFVPMRQLRRLNSGLLVRTHVDPASLQSAIRTALAEVDPGSALTSVMPMDDRLARVTARPRIVAVLLGVFGAVSLCLVAVGLYGTVAFAVARRTREIGLRASLGAGQVSLSLLVLRHGLAVTAAGLVVGAIGALWGTRYLEGLLFGIQGLGAIELAGVSLVLLVVSAAAAYVPARRAMRIDPVVALRSD